MNFVVVCILVAHGVVDMSAAKWLLGYEALNTLVKVYLTSSTPSDKLDLDTNGKKVMFMLVTAAYSLMAYFASVWAVGQWIPG